MTVIQVQKVSRMKCSRCGRRYRGRPDWNGTFSRGVLMGLLCPNCQTPEENAEAVINEATRTYTVDAFGRVRYFPKGVTE